MVRIPIEKLLPAILALGVTTHGSPASAQTASEQGTALPAPVAITYVRVADLKSDEGRRGTIYLSFQNNGVVAANEVRFAVRHGQAVTEVRDTGLFSPHVRIDHRFASQNAPQWSTGSWASRASVEYVHFIDGATWSAVGEERNQARG